MKQLSYVEFDVMWESSVHCCEGVDIVSIFTPSDFSINNVIYVMFWIFSVYTVMLSHV